MRGRDEELYLYETLTATSRSSAGSTRPCPCDNVASTVTAEYRLLQQYGIDACDTELGRQLGGGLFESLPRRDYRSFQQSGRLR